MHSTIDRRRFVLGLGAARLAVVVSRRRARDGPQRQVRPADQGRRRARSRASDLRGVRDVGIRNGIDRGGRGRHPRRAGAAGARRLGQARRRPGLIDLHAHTYPYGSAIGIPADELVPFQGTTTAVSAGDAGANNFAAFRRFIVASTRTRLYAFVHIANIGLAGFPIAELYNLDYARTEDAARTLAENADIALGIKVRMSENVIAKHGLEPLKRAIKACELSGTGRQGHVPHRRRRDTAAHVARSSTCCDRSDILTHCYSGAPNIAGKFTNIVQDGKLLPAALDAKKRGVHFDVGHGGGSFDYTVAEAAIAQGAGPDTISSDMHVFSGNSPGMPYLTWVMSKFLNMGFTLEQVVAMATINPARAIDKVAEARHAAGGRARRRHDPRRGRGSGRVRRHAQQQAPGKVHLKPVQTVAAGIAFGRPYSAPFSVR